MENISYAREYKIKAQKVTKKAESKNIISSYSAYEFARNFYNEDVKLYESCFIMLLDRGNNVIGWFKVSQGGVTSTIVDIKLIAKVAIDSLASAVIMVHNHPSGNIKPGNQDQKQTDLVKNALKILDIDLLDHLIIAEREYFSFADEGLI